MSLDKLFPKASAALQAAIAANAEQYGEGLTFKPHHIELDKAVSHLMQSTINNDNSEDHTTHRISAALRLLKVIEIEE